MKKVTGCRKNTSRRERSPSKKRTATRTQLHLSLARMTVGSSYRPVGCVKATASSVVWFIAAVTFSLSFICRCQGFVFPANGPHVSALTAQQWQQGRANTLHSTESRKSSGGVGSCGGDRGVGWRQRRPTKNREQYVDGALRMSVRDMIGADVESGGLFDPLGFSKDEPSLFRRRAVELKHGRVAMLAMVGILVQSFVRFPGFPPFPVADPGRPLEVFGRLCAAEGKAVVLALLCIGVLDVTIGKQDYVDKAPGELGEFGALAKPVDEDEWEKVQMAELKHGRLAMLAVTGCLVQEVVTGQGPVEQLMSGNVNPFT